MVAKLESANPTGSMKDRVALAMVAAAAADGRLAPGGTVVEYTAGTKGISLALICAARGYKAHFVFSDAFSDEKRWTMRAYGAELTDVASDQGTITARLFKAMIANAGEISRRPLHWYCDQLNNRDGETGYHPLGEKLWEQSGGRVVVQAVGTAHSIHDRRFRAFHVRSLMALARSGGSAHDRPLGRPPKRYPSSTPRMNAASSRIQRHSAANCAWPLRHDLPRTFDQPPCGGGLCARTLSAIF